ncbi:MAG: DUF1501 domain-containing protein [Pirellulales bacterium]
MWLAGGGVRGGDLRCHRRSRPRAVENVMTPNDYQATLLHLFGLNHADLVFQHNGQTQTLTASRPAQIVGDILEHAPVVVG